MVYKYDEAMTLRGLFPDTLQGAEMMQSIRQSFITRYAVIGLSLAVTGCAGDPALVKPSSQPFEGCWQTESNLEREVWARDPSGWMFGYSLSRNDAGDITFFEHMRIEVRGQDYSFVVIRQSGDIVRFERELTDAGDAEFKFVNAAHDYPQMITYTPGEGRLDARISMLDGSKARDFKKRACAVL